MKTYIISLILSTVLVTSCMQNLDESKSIKPSEVSKEGNFNSNEKWTNENTINDSIMLTQLITNIDSTNKRLDWKQTESGLWRSKSNDIGFLTLGGIRDLITKVYITTLSDGRPLVEVIDIDTFRYLGSSFYKDKNHIYTFYEMAGGGKIWILEDTDVESFEILGDCYAKDRSFIYGERAMKIDGVDYDTFKTCKDCNCYAKDKNGYYYWSSRIEDVNTITDVETLTILEKLKH